MDYHNTTIRYTADVCLKWNIYLSCSLDVLDVTLYVHSKLCRHWVDITPFCQRTRTRKQKKEIFFLPNQFWGLNQGSQIWIWQCKYNIINKLLICVSRTNFTKHLLNLYNVFHCFYTNFFRDFLQRVLC